MCALLASLGSMNCLLECSYYLWMHYGSCGRPTLNFIECFDLGHSFLDSEAGLILFTVIRQVKIRAFKDICESSKGTFEQEAEVTNTLQRISRSLPKFMIILVELMYFVMLCKAFHERTCKHYSERKSYESSERSFNNLSFRKTYKPTQCQK